MSASTAQDEDTIPVDIQNTDDHLFKFRPSLGLALEIWGGEPDQLKVVQYSNYPYFEPTV